MNVAARKNPDPYLRQEDFGFTVDELRDEVARLAEARERGEDFDSAWHGAVAPLRLDEKIGSKGERRLRREWSAALRFARPAFKAAFYGEAAEQGEHAAAALEDMLAA